MLGCQENPCAGESEPSISWPNTKGCFRLPPNAISNPSECYLFLNDTNQLECDDEFGLRGVGSSAGRLHKLLAIYQTNAQFQIYQKFHRFYVSVQNARNVKFGALAEGSALTSFNLFMQPVKQIN